jgi:hypothetical protein
MSKATPDKLKEAKSAVRAKFLAGLMLNGANAAKYNDLKRGMAENYVTGTSEYPESLGLVLCILNAYQLPPGWNVNQGKQEVGLEPTKELLCLLKLEMTAGRLTMNASYVVIGAI